VLEQYTEGLAREHRISAKERQRAEWMEELGLTVRFCNVCKCAFPRPFRFTRAICSACDREQMKRRAGWRWRPGAYVDDGHGCVEQIPAWMVDWDGDRGHPSDK